MRLRNVSMTIALLLASLWDPVPACGQGWVARYNGPANGDDRGSVIAVDTAGNTYVTGDSLGVGTGLDILTAKYDRAGNLVWTRRYNAPYNGEDVAWNLALDASGSVYVSGRSAVAFQNSDYVTIKYDPDGNELWSRRYNGPGNREDSPSSLFVDAYGNAYVTGYSFGGLTTNWDFATVKYDPQGNELWVARFADPSEDSASYVTADAGGAVYVAGRSWRGTTTGRYDFRVVKYDANGGQVWTATYNGPSNWDDEAVSVGVDAAGNVYAAGSSSSSTNFDYTTIKYDPNGTRLWVARYDGPAHAADNLYAMAVEPDGTVYVTGASRSTASASGFATLRYSPAGGQVWIARHDSGAGLGGGRSVRLDSAGNVLVAGQDFVNGTLDLAAVKYDANGAELWSQTYDGPAHGEDYASSSALDLYGNLFAAGGSAGSGTGRDLLAVKFAVAGSGTSLTAADAAGSVGQTVTLSASLFSAAAGGGLSGQALSFKVSNVEIPGSPVTTGADGKANISYKIPEGSVGPNSIQVSFAGDSAAEPSFGSATLAVSKSATTILVSDAGGTIGKSVSLSASLTRDSDNSALSGRSVVIKLDGVELPGSPVTTDATGVAILNYQVPEGSAGEHEIVASFPGDADYQPGEKNAKLTVSKAASSLAVENASGDPGVTVGLMATLKSSDGKPLSGRSISFQVDGQSAGTGTTDAQGVASGSYAIPLSSAPGDRAIVASFSGDADYESSSASSSLSVRGRTMLAIYDAFGSVGQGIHLRASLRSIAAGVAGKPVRFKVDGAEVGTAMTDLSGLAALPHTITESTGIHEIVASFDGDADHRAVTSNPGKLSVNLVKSWLDVSSITAVPERDVSLKARLRTAGAGLPGKVIRFFIDGVELGVATTNSEGVARLAHVISEAVGVHSITAEYAGDAKYTPSSGSGILTVNLINTSISVAMTTARPGETVSLKAKLRAGDHVLPGRVLDFQVDGQPVGQATTNAEGIALLPYAAGDNLGEHVITARYAGDSVKYAPSSKDGTLRIIGVPKIVADSVRAKAGSVVSYGATLLIGDSGAPLPGKRLHFYACDRLVGCGVTDQNGRAAVMLKAPMAGKKLAVEVRFVPTDGYRGANATGRITGY